MTYPSERRSTAVSWTRAEIRAARQQDIAPVLGSLGYALEQHECGNTLVCGLPGRVIIKRNYWMNHEDGSSGNAIDFFVKLCGKSFNETMHLLLQPAGEDAV